MVLRVYSSLMELLSLFFTLLLFPAMARAENPFPEKYTPEAGLSFTHQVRAEGRIHEMDSIEKLAYLWKYLYYHKKTAPKEMVEHFNHQRLLVSALESEKSWKQEAQNSMRLGLTGDIMWIRDNWENFLSEALLARLRKSDAIVGNLETVISSRFDVPSFLPDAFAYNSKPELVTKFTKENGESLFGALSFANNHTLDFGDQGAIDTMDFLDRQKIPHSGVRRNAQEKKWVSFQRNGIRVGFYAATYGVNESELEKTTKLSISLLPGSAPEGRKPVDLSEVEKVLAEMDAEKIDFKIISLHWGFEYEYYPSIIQMQTARKIVALGADLILGNHPHVVQPDEICFVNGYENRYSHDAKEKLGAIHPNTGCMIKSKDGKARKALVVYAMGNFTTAMFTFPCKAGVYKEISLFKNKEGHTDWAAPEYVYLYNQNSDQEGKRKFLLMQDFLRQNCVEIDPKCESQKGQSCKQKSGCSTEILSALEYLDKQLRHKEGEGLLAQVSLTKVQRSIAQQKKMTRKTKKP